MGGMKGAIGRVRRGEREAVIMVEDEGDAKNGPTCPMAKSDGISECIASVDA
jgi:hypothetical protein